VRSPQPLVDGILAMLSMIVADDASSAVLSSVGLLMLALGTLV
jgi:hypothetical protein